MQKTDIHRQADKCGIHADEIFCYKDIFVAETTLFLQPDVF